MRSLGLGAKKVLPIPQDQYQIDLTMALEDMFREIDDNLKFVTRVNVKTVTTNYTLSDNDYAVIGTASMTLTLPAVSPSNGKVVFLKNIGASTATVAAQSGENIDGSNTYNLANQYDCVKLVSDGTDWHILSTV